MFDFEKLTIYKKAKLFNAGTRKFLRTTKLDAGTRDQLRRASFSIVLNIAEGSGRFSKADRRNFYIISRSSIFECIAIFDILRDEDEIDVVMYNEFYVLLQLVDECFTLRRHYILKSDNIIFHHQNLDN